MRINRYVALATGYSRRQADKLIDEGRVLVDGLSAKPGQTVTSNQKVSLDDQPLNLPVSLTTVMINKPVGYVVSRDGQGSKTIYDLLPDKYKELKPVGRLDKVSSGLLLITNDGKLAHQLSHPSSGKLKVYVVSLNKPLSEKHIDLVNNEGVILEDGVSRLAVDKQGNGYRISMSEGRNRQIRRTFEAIGYKVVGLHRLSFGDYRLNDLPAGRYLEL